MVKLLVLVMHFFENIFSIHTNSSLQFQYVIIAICDFVYTIIVILITFILIFVNV